jgi:hypothetical protein
MPIHMEPTRVGTAGTELNQVAEDAGSPIRSRFTSSEEAVEGNRGWRTSTSLRRCHANWQTRLAGLVEQTRQAGEALISSAGTVAASDAEAESRIGGVLRALAEQ